MKCPICGNDTGNMFCESCGKSIPDIYLKIVEELQAARNYDKALEMLNELRNNTTDREILDEIRDIEEAIEFAKVQAERTQDYEMKGENFSKKKVIVSVFVMILVIIAANIAFLKIIIDKKPKEQNLTQSSEKTDLQQIENNKILSQFIYKDIAEIMANYRDIIEERDINGDGIKEIVVVYEKNYMVFSKENGGNLLYWYDLAAKVKLVGSAFEAMNIKNSNYELISGGDGFELSKADMKYEIEGKNKLIFEGHGVKKIITFSISGIDVEYISTRTGGMEIKILLEPDFGTIYEKGAGVVTVEEGNGFVKAINTVSSKALTVEYGSENNKILLDDKNGKNLIIKIKSINYKLGIKKSE